jgi:hypothetical protein
MMKQLSAALLAWSIFTATAFAAESTTTNYPIEVDPAVVFTNVAALRSRNTGVQSPPTIITVTNTGAVAVNWGGFSLGGANAGDFTILASTCVSSIAPSAQCRVTVGYTPSTLGLESATIQIMNSNGHVYSAPLIGTNATPIAITLAPTSTTVPVGTVAGDVLSNATVTTADGGPYLGSLSTDNPGIFGISGLTVVTSRVAVPADDGQTFTTNITANP